MAGGPECWSALRARLSDLLRADHPQAPDHQRALSPHLLPMADVTMLKPALIGNYTDFYASIHHATKCGQAVPAGQSPLAQLQVCADRISRPGVVDRGQRHGREAARRPDCVVAWAAPHFASTRALDYELEAGFFVGPGNTWEKRSPSRTRASHLFGVCLLNDWSARDIQAWEYQPLGPFLAKSFATTISPWIVTMEALAPFRTSAFARPPEDPPPLDYLTSEQDSREGGIDLILEVYLRSARNG